MGIYLPNMEMPKTCHECRLYEGDIYYCSAADKEIDIPDSSEEKCKFCPLVPVPPHGRMIDADEIVRYKERLVVDADKINPKIRYVVDTKYIDGTPTIIPAEPAEEG